MVQVRIALYGALKTSELIICVSGDDASLGFECDELSAINELRTALQRRRVRPTKVSPGL